MHKQVFRWMSAFASLAMLVVGAAFLVTLDELNLTLFLVVSLVYLVGGYIAIAAGDPLDAEDIKAAPRSVRWAWVAPVLAAAIGIASAVTALLARSIVPSLYSEQVLAVIASLGVFLSWMLLQVGFAQIYMLADITDPDEGLRFPRGVQTSMLAFVYFSFTLGTSFATSDVEVISVRLRKLVLIHAVLAFFYNALVVAVAFQVLQQAVSP